MELDTRELFRYLARDCNYRDEKLCDVSKADCIARDYILLSKLKNLYPVGGIQVRREDEQAAPTGLRTPVWSTRHIIPVGLTVVLDVALVQDQTAPLGATK